MLRFVRTSTIAPGKLQPAMAFAADVAAHVKSVTGTPVNVFSQVGGVMGRTCWQADFDNLAAYGQQMGQLMGDADYIKKVTQAGQDGLFLAGGARDSLWTQN